MAGAESIVDQDSLMAWLNSQPDDRKRVTVAVMASRMAMRLLPFLARQRSGTAAQQAAVFNRAFWRLSIARSCRSWPDQQIGIAGLHTASGSSLLISDGITSSVSVAIASATLAATTPNDLMSVAFAASEAVALVRPDPTEYLGFSITDIVEDAIYIESNSNPNLLHGVALFRVEPRWWKHEIEVLRYAFVAPFLAQENLGVWMGWYETIAKGLPAFGLKDRKTAEALERAIALGGRDGKFHKEFWDREPGEINREIAEWVAEARAAEVVGGDAIAVPAESDFPAQSLDATMFGINADGLIERIAVPPEQQLLITPLQRKQYEAVRADAEALLAQGQILGDKLKTQISNLIKALPVDMSHAAVFDVWRAINRLRRTWNAHVAVANLGEPHEAKLELGVVEDLGELLDTANNFAFDDPRIRERDENSVPPQDKQSIADEKRLGDAIAKGALEMPEIFTPGAFESVNAEEQNARDAGDDPHGQQAKEQTIKTRRNLFAAMLAVFKGESGSAWKEMRSGYYKKIGERAGDATIGAGIVAVSDYFGITAVYPSVANFLIKNGNSLLAYVKAVYNNPSLTAYIEQLLKAVGL